MLEVSSAREIRGSYALPPSPDLFLLSAVVALTSDGSTTVTPAPVCPLVDQWKAALEKHLCFSQNGDACTLRRADTPENLPIVLTLDSLPYRDFILFCLLGLGKTLQVSPVSDKRVSRWTSLLQRVHCAVDAVVDADRATLRLVPDQCSFALPADEITPDDLLAYIGLALGLRSSLACEQDDPFLSPIRHLLPLFGFTLSVTSSSADKVIDPIAKRIQRMKKKKVDPTTPVYTVTADFSHRPAADVNITLPGDDVLAAVLFCAKGLVQKGNLVVENVPLEVWSTQALQFARRMGCAPGIQQSGTGSFGAVGMVQLQRFDLAGRKVDCRPLFHFVSQLPCMVMQSAFAEGESVFRGLDDLRLDVPDGVEGLMECLRRLEVRHGEMPDGIVLKGSKNLDGFDVTANLPAHLSGALAAAGLRCQGKTTVADEALRVRWPSFEQMLTDLCEFKDHKTS
jgi:hypothetical protein